LDSTIIMIRMPLLIYKFINAREENSICSFVTTLSTEAKQLSILFR